MKARGKVSAWLARESLLRHVVVLIDDTVAGLEIALNGGGKVGCVTYENHKGKENREASIRAKVKDCLAWGRSVLNKECGYRNGRYSLGKAELDLLNGKIRVVNRWSMAAGLDQWKEMVVVMATLNLALFYVRLFRHDSTWLKTYYAKVNDLCLALGGGEDWLLAEDCWEASHHDLLYGMDMGGLTSEEEYFFRFVALPMARTELESEVMRGRGHTPTTAELLSIGA